MTDASSHSMQHSADPPEPDPDFVKWLKAHCVPIVGMTLGALVLCLITRYSSITVDWTRTKEFTGAFANVTQSLALIAGGIWAYFKFVKGRTFEDRLTPTVSGKILSIDGSVFLVVTTHFQNVGLSRIAFNPKASMLVVSEYIPAEGEEIVSVRNKRLTSSGFSETRTGISSHMKSSNGSAWCADTGREHRVSARIGGHVRFRICVACHGHCRQFCFLG